VLSCFELNRDGKGLPRLARRCESSDACGVTCTGVPDGQGCAGARLLRSIILDPFEIPCGPFSRCGAESLLCEPRTCANTSATGACTNATDCAALADGLERAFEITLDCAADNPGTIATCVAETVGLTAGCASCFADLTGDFEACAGL
jgi:hypothetical protein